MESCQLQTESIFYGRTDTTPKALGSGRPSPMLRCVSQATKELDKMAPGTGRAHQPNTEGIETLGGNHNWPP